MELVGTPVFEQAVTLFQSNYLLINQDTLSRLMTAPVESLHGLWNDVKRLNWYAFNPNFSQIGERNDLNIKIVSCI